MPIFRNKDLYVIGGGDSAVEEATFLTKYAKHVYLVHRRDELRASKIMAERAKKHDKITILWDSVIKEIKGDKTVGSVVIENVKTKQAEEKEAGGVFFAIGHKPNTDFLHDQVALYENGYIKVEPGSTRTSVKGVFAAGDVADFTYRQAITAAGTGCMAALDAERYIAELAE
jgi:thioredoxin reductase (NADPH)